MKLIINNEEKNLEKNISLVKLLEVCRVEMPDMVSVQLNGEFVGRESFAATFLQENDRIDFLYFMGGGEGDDYTTKSIHSSYLKKDPHGALNFPVYDSVAFEFDSAQDIAQAFAGQKLAHSYSRITNPTVENFEQKVKQISGASGVAALSSGMAAIANTLLTICQSGENIITTRKIFGNTYSLLEKTLKPWGLSARYVDLTNPQEAKASIDAKTRAIFFESITNPQLEIADAAALASLAKEKNILLIADTTATPLVFFRAKEIGVDLELISATKYISGGATSVGGLIVDYGNYDWRHNPRLAEAYKKYGPQALLTTLKRESYRNLGACLSPHNAYLQSLGLDTLMLRIERSGQNSLEIAGYLQKQDKVKSVNYPGLAGSQHHILAKKQFNGRYGALLTFRLKDKASCFKFINALKLVRRATNINDNKTLVIHPASTIFCEYSVELREQMGVYDDLVRLSVGIEDADRLKADLGQALEVI